MNIRHTLPGLLAASIFFSGIGCQKSGSGEPSAALTPTKLSPDTVLRVHWRGKNDLGIAASAYYFMRVWELPQSGQVEIQALAKLSTAPWRWLPGETEAGATSNSLQLYPLLADVIWNESYFEIRRPANQPAEYVLAIRLDAAHQQLWQTNLAAVAQSLTGARPVPAPDGQFGWSLENLHGFKTLPGEHDPGRDALPRVQAGQQASPTRSSGARDPLQRISLSRVGQWTLVSAGPDQNALASEIAARIRREHTPYVSQTPGDWLEADLDPSRLAALIPLSARAAGGEARGGVGVKTNFALEHIHLTVTGDGGHVLTHADLTFSRPLPVELQSWTVPADLIHPPLMSFTAARGMNPWLASWKTWSGLQIGPPPDQVYSWSLPGGQFQTYFAAPLPDAAGEVRALSEYLLQKANPWLAANSYLGFEPGPDSNGVFWGRSPAIRPFVQSAAAGAAGGVAYGGFIPETGAETRTNFYYEHPSFPELLQELSGQTNLVYYHWELTGARIASCLYLGQFLSVITRHQPLPLDSAAALWLKAVQPRLGNCTTTLTRAGPNRLSFDRCSTVGFTAAELNFLAAWLESPQFPKW